ncbi:MAG: helix-turn-helix domain-containing protein [Steroidobacteraceae bacterium]
MDKTARKILARSVALFAERGFKAVTVRDITEACDIHMPTLYRKFGDKRALYRAVVTEALTRSTAEVMHSVRDESEPPQERLFSYVLISIRQLAEQRPYTRILDRELLDPIEPETLDALVDSIVMPMYRAVGNIVHQLAAHSDGPKVAFELAADAYAAGKLLLFRRHVTSTQDRTVEIERLAAEITTRAVAQLETSESDRHSKQTSSQRELREKNKRLEAALARVMVENAQLREQLYGAARSTKAPVRLRR